VNVRGIPLKIMDTAGLHPAREQVEVEGVRRTRERLAHADLVIWVLDGSEPITTQDLDILPQVQPGKTVVAVNKNDLPRRLDPRDLGENLRGAPLIPVSALLHSGIDRLEEAIGELVLDGKQDSSAEILLSNLRHKQALEKAREGLAQALATSRANLSAEFISVDLGRALQALGEIVGETTSEDILDRVFSQFCIGK
jgi:tRNA modification GTPase